MFQQIVMKQNTPETMADFTERCLKTFASICFLHESFLVLLSGCQGIPQRKLYYVTVLRPVKNHIG